MRLIKPGFGLFSPYESVDVTRFIVDVVKNLFLAVIIVVFFVLFVVQPVRVEGTSMEPQLGDQERVFISKFTYRVFPIERGDVVVFHYPADVTKSFIKRVIALPGERLEVIHGRVFINGHRLTEDYLSEHSHDTLNIPSMEVPAGSYFVMGDHRSVSNDSRHWGALPAEFIYGKAIFKYWPLSDIGLVR